MDDGHSEIPGVDVFVPRGRRSAPIIVFVENLRAGKESDDGVAAADFFHALAVAVVGVRARAAAVADRNDVIFGVVNERVDAVVSHVAAGILTLGNKFEGEKIAGRKAGAVDSECCVQDLRKNLRTRTAEGAVRMRRTCEDLRFTEKVRRAEDEGREPNAEARNAQRSEKGRRGELLERGGRRGVEENIGDFTTDIYSMSSQMLVTIRIGAEVDEF